MSDPRGLKVRLLKAGATLVGIGDVSDALTGDIAHLRRGVAIALDRTLSATSAGLLLEIQSEAEKWLRARGYRFFSIPPDSDRRMEKFASRLYELFCHKTAATCSGLGWIGKNGLIINRHFGAKLSWATVLTDAPFTPDAPFSESLCGGCSLCVEHCPSGALTGVRWSLENPFEPLVIYDKCRSLKDSRRTFEEKPNCGLCINICPYSRRRLRAAPEGRPKGLAASNKEVQFK